MIHALIVAAIVCVLAGTSIYAIIRLTPEDDDR